MIQTLSQRCLNTAYSHAKVYAKVIDKYPACHSPGVDYASSPFLPSNWIKDHFKISKTAFKLERAIIRLLRRTKSNLDTIMNQQFPLRLLYIKRDPQSGVKLAELEGKPVKEKTFTQNFPKHICSSISNRITDLFCPSVQKKIPKKVGDRYQCGYKYY